MRCLKEDAQALEGVHRVRVAVEGPHGRGRAEAPLLREDEVPPREDALRGGVEAPDVRNAARDARRPRELPRRTRQEHVAERLEVLRVVRRGDVASRVLAAVIDVDGAPGPRQVGVEARDQPRRRGALVFVAGVRKRGQHPAQV